MTRVLAFDIGTRRTGVAFGDTSDGVVVSLDTILHHSPDELVEAVAVIVKEKSITHIVVGLPRLPSGEEGEQAAFSRSVGDAFVARGWPVTYIDERFTTSKDESVDGDAKAAIELLQLAFQNGIDKL